MRKRNPDVAISRRYSLKEMLLLILMQMIISDDEYRFLACIIVTLAILILHILITLAILVVTLGILLGIVVHINNSGPGLWFWSCHRKLK